jgi:predicted transcriptional regulator
VKRLDEKLRIAKIILEKLSEGPMRWTPLMKVVVKESPSQWKAQVILKWLLEKGYVIRQERGVYQITENGRELLKNI